MNKIKSRLKLIGEGDSLKDKFFLVLFSILSPLKKEGTDFLWHDITMKTPYGKFIFRKGKDDISIFMGYDDVLNKYLTLKKGIFIDIGSHIGKYAIKIGNEVQKSGKVIAVELMPDNFRHLLVNIRLNHLNNVVPLNVGCDLENGEKNIYGPRNKNSTVGYSLMSSENSRIFGRVPVKKLDTIVKEQQLEKIDLIKIDVEGMELPVLMGGLNSIKKFRPRMVIEADTEKLDRIKSLLMPLKYKIMKIDSANILALPL